MIVAWTVNRFDADFGKVEVRVFENPDEGERFALDLIADGAFSVVTEPIKEMIS